MKHSLSLCAVGVMVVASVVKPYAVDTQIGDPRDTDTADRRSLPGHEGSTAAVAKTPESEIPYTVKDDDDPRESRAQGRPRSRAPEDDPYGGCRLRCPQGFNRQDFHIHMHRWNRPVNKGGVEPNHGLYHHDWRARAE